MKKTLSWLISATIFSFATSLVFSSPLVLATTIGTDVNTNNLTVDGGLKITVGAALNDILTSDAAGNASWAAPAAIKTDLSLGAADSPTFTGLTLSGPLTGATNITASGIIQGGTLTDGTFSVTGGAITGASGNISQWTNNAGYLTAETDPVYSANTFATGMNQGVSSGSSPTFVNVTSNLTGNVIGNVTGNVSGTSGSTTGNAATVTNGVYTTDAGTVFLAPNGIGSGLTALTPANISAGTATGLNITGNAATATTANNVTGTVAVANGGTGATTASSALTNLGAAASGANSDITSLTGLTSTGLVLGTGANATTFTSTATAPRTILFPDASGTVAVSASGLISLSVLGDITCPTCMTSTLASGKIFVGNAGNVATPVTMSGDATIDNTGAVTVASRDYAMFYGLTAGTGNAGPTDYAATVAVKTAVGTGRVPFPRTGSLLGIIRLDGSSFILPDAGTYEVTFNVHTTEPGQLALEVNGTEEPECTGEDFNPTSGGHPIAVNCIITAGAGAVLSVVNPSGNSTALTITPADGAETHANSQTLLIKKL